MTGALFLVGGCYIVTAVGLVSVRAAARILLVVAGLSTIGIAASPEPASGPTPQHLAWTTRRDHDRDMACLRRPAATSAPADPGHLQLSRGDRRVRGPARLAPHRSPGAAPTWAWPSA